jgi:PAS domain S-box-containing protein
MGGIDVCEYAQSKGIPSYPLPMSRESIWQAISEAKHNALIRHRERARAIQYQTVINYASEGVIATDKNGNIITFNSAAERMLGTNKRDALEYPAKEVLRNTGLHELLCNSQEYHDALFDNNTYSLKVNKVRMILDGGYIGDVVTFQDVASIQKAESIIRDKIYSRGHVAKYKFSHIIGSSLQLNDVIEMAKVYANVQSNILITGETGTGKELLAQSIHNGGQQKNGPFVAVNCAALAKSLIESELFGYSEGAFTGASKGGKPGVFELAHGGTIFLDEISEMPLDIQGRLLRVIQEKEVVRIGDNRVIPVDVRIICASNRSLFDLASKGEFRKDLYYRLNVLTLNLPPLRERQEDILAIVGYYLNIFSNTYGKERMELTNGAEELLLKHEWYGNAREIRNVCERLCILNRTGIVMRDDVLRAVSDELSLPRPQNSADSLVVETDRLERQRLIEVLESCSYNKSIAAKALGISRTTLWRRMRSYNIPMEAQKLPQ